MIGRFGLTSGASVGVATGPWAVSRTPIRARPSRSRTSNIRGHPAHANKAFPRLRAPLRKDYVSRGGFRGRGCCARRSSTSPAWATERRSVSGGAESARGTISRRDRNPVGCRLGSRFDVPFLRKAFPRMHLDQIHLDLVHPLRRLGFVGGLKAIESQVGILRSEETTGLGGFDAVRLWRAHDEGDDDALDLLLRYNMEDVVNLEPLTELAYEGLRSLCLDGGFVTADRLPNRSRPPSRAPHKSRT